MAYSYAFISCDNLGLHMKKLCQKQVSKAGRSNYIPQYLWDVITFPCPWYLLLAQHSSYHSNVFHNQHPYNVSSIKWLGSHEFCMSTCCLHKLYAIKIKNIYNLLYNHWAARSHYLCISSTHGPAPWLPILVICWENIDEKTYTHTHLDLYISQNKLSNTRVNIQANEPHFPISCCRRSPI